MSDYLQAAENVRKAADELNKYIREAANYLVEVEVDTFTNYQINGADVTIVDVKTRKLLR